MSGVVAAVIPVRYGSTRLPAKPLLRQTGKYLVEHVYERVCRARSIDRVLVATDDERILRAVESFGAAAVMTAKSHRTGTDRVAEVARTLDADAVINVQGDEPETDPADLDRLAAAIRQPDACIATLAAPIADPAIYADPNAVKVVVDGAGRALYFSRAPIPWASDAAGVRGALATGAVRKHVGIYAFTKDALLAFAALPQPPIETLERLEQLRALHNSMPIRVLDTDHDPVGIDTEEDYRRFVARTMAGTREAP